MVNTDFIQNCSNWGEGPPYIQHENLETHSQGAGWGQLDTKLLRGNMGSEADSDFNPLNRILAEDTPGDQISDGERGIWPDIKGHQVWAEGGSN